MGDKDDTASGNNEEKQYRMVRIFIESSIIISVVCVAFAQLLLSYYIVSVVSEEEFLNRAFVFLSLIFSPFIF